MSLRTPGLIRIPQWAIVNRLLTAQDVAFGADNVEISRVRTNLTGAVVHFTVRDENGTIVIQKDSTDITQIEIKNQALAALEGQYNVKFVEADTAPLSTTAIYWFDSWAATSDGFEEPVIDTGRFFVDKSQTHISEGPAPSLPTYPASQTERLQSFQWVVTSTGTSHTVTIPTAMVNSTYIATVTPNTIAGATFPICVCPESGRTTTTFPMSTSISITAGDTLDFLVRDRS